MSETKKEKQNFISRLSGWYFSKKVLPYWCILLLDTVIVFVSCVGCYWMQNRTTDLLHGHGGVFYTSTLYAFLSWVGARVFRTYTGVVRYSSLTDLLRIAYANMASLVLALASELLFKKLGVPKLCALSFSSIVGAFVVSTMLMWLMRIAVRALFEQFDDFVGRELLVLRPARKHRLPYLKMGEQFHRMPCVFRRHQVNGAEGFQGSHSNVAQVAYRRSNDIQDCHDSLLYSIFRFFSREKWSENYAASPSQP